MSSRREQIIEYVVTQLNSGIGIPAGLTVHRSRTIPIENDTLPAMVVYPIEEQVVVGPAMGVVSPNTPPQRKSRRTLTLRVELRVDATASNANQPDASLDAYHLWMASRIGADPTMGGLTHDCKEIRSVFDAASVDAVYAASQTDFLVDYVTLSNDLTQAP